jgi:phage virion morphogenesis protein
MAQYCFCSPIDTYLFAVLRLNRFFRLPQETGLKQMELIFEVNSKNVEASLQRLQHAASNMTPALVAIGEDMVKSTKRRFGEQRGPDGQLWHPISDEWVYEKEAMGASILILTQWGTLGDTINYQVPNATTLEVGSPMQYAAMMQFGGTKEEFPYLWGDIPARPFLGVSNEDEQEIVETITDYLQSMFY